MSQGPKDYQQGTLCSSNLRSRNANDQSDGVLRKWKSLVATILPLEDEIKAGSACAPPTSVSGVQKMLLTSYHHNPIYCLLHASFSESESVRPQNLPSFFRHDNMIKHSILVPTSKYRWQATRGTLTGSAN